MSAYHGCKIAVKSRWLEGVKYFLQERKCPLTEDTGSGAKSVLVVEAASVNSNIPVLELLLSCGANIDEADGLGGCILLKAISCEPEDLEQFKFLVEKGRWLKCKFNCNIN